jgi:NAD/NADP transhydrogenase beta subunit
VADERPSGGEYRQARQTVAFLLIVLVAAIVVGDVVRPGPRGIDLPVVVALLLTAAGMLAVDIPGLRR